MLLLCGFVVAQLRKVDVTSSDLIRVDPTSETFDDRVKTASYAGVNVDVDTRIRVQDGV